MEKIYIESVERWGVPRGLRRSDALSEGAVVAPEPQGEEQHIDTIRQNSNIAVALNCGVATTQRVGV